MNKFVGCIAGVITLAGCGGGTPYVGLWQCTDDPTASLEIRKYEDYFVIKVRLAERESTKEGSFMNGVFSVGANNVGQAMAFELQDAGLICTNPPNFCQCPSAYKKVTSIDSNPPQSGEQKPDSTSADKASENQVDVADLQIVTNAEPVVFDLDNGGAVTIFDHVLNEEYEKRMYDWPKLTFFYLPAILFDKLANGKLAEVQQSEGGASVFFQLTAAKLDKFELLENFHETVNAKIVPTRVTPLMFGKLQVRLPGTNVQNVSVDVPLDFIESNDTIGISLTVPSGQTSADDLHESANQIADAINLGQIKPLITLDLKQRSSVDTSLPENNVNRMDSWEVEVNRAF